MAAVKILVCERILEYGDETQFDSFRVRPKSLEIHRRAVATAKRYLTSESDLLDIFEELENDRTYLEFGEPSTFQYAQKYLKLSESVVCHFTSIVRKSKTVPELKEAIREGALTVSKARKIVPVITADNKEQWLELATSSSARQIEKAVATENPKLCVRESIKYKSADRLELKLGVSEEWTETLKLAKDVASQKAQKAVDTEETLKIAMEFYLKHHDPLAKSRRSQERLAKKAQKSAEEIKQGEKFNEFDGRCEQHLQIDQAVLEKNSQVNPIQRSLGTLKVSFKKLPVTGPVNFNRIQRRPLSSALKHAATWRDQRRCTHLDVDGFRCQATGWLDVHHIVEVSKGGADTLENLATLCSQHHRLRHR